MAIVGDELLSLIISKTSFAWYLSKMGQGSGESTLLLLFSIFLVFYLLKERIASFDDSADLWLWTLAVAIVFNVLALNFGIFERSMKLFLPFLAIIVPDILLALKKEKILFWGASTCVCVFFAFYYKVIVIGSTAIAEGWLQYSMR
jgi:hypothetical protein